jgi:nucleoside-diphosphate-sugar epimerase
MLLPVADMRILVAGATGALGAPLVRRLVASGHEVLGTTRSARRRPELESAGARAVVVDALDARRLDEALQAAAPEAVVDLLTALPRAGPRWARDMIATNRLRTRGTANLLGAAIRSKVRRIVAESFVLAYGWRLDGEAPHGEAFPRARRAPTPALQPTLDAIRALEDQVLGASPQIEPVVLRIGFIYGLGTGWTEALMERLWRRTAPRVGAADAACPWVHLDDVTRALALAITRGMPGAVYNIVDDHPAPFRDFQVALAQALDAPPPWPLPERLLALFMPYAASMAAVRLRLSNARARQDLGWGPAYTSYREGLADLVARLGGATVGAVESPSY